MKDGWDFRIFMVFLWASSRYGRVANIRCDFYAILRTGACVQVHPLVFAIHCFRGAIVKFMRTRRI